MQISRPAAGNPLSSLARHQLTPGVLIVHWIMSRLARDQRVPHTSSGEKAQELLEYSENFSFYPKLLVWCTMTVWMAESNPEFFALWGNKYDSSGSRWRKCNGITEEQRNDVTCGSTLRVQTESCVVSSEWSRTTSLPERERTVPYWKWRLPATPDFWAIGVIKQILKQKMVLW